MPHYQAGKTMHLRDSHNILIIPPLAIILVSCFIFVLVQPHTAKISGPAASTHSAPGSSQPQATLQMAQNEPLPTIESTVVVDPTPPAAGPNNRATTTPQPTKTSSSSLQSAITNNQASTSRIYVPSAKKSLSTKH